ncbi:glycogen synthase [Lentisphaera marina]|uniref:glycogen synthase n=1 Tax=Lentisphaera marina TaxID=1111041 RepID=UPI0023664419|nr:glycogen synthase [Lentisphaera marina]MDD7987417.1 glycogen synthase [Lentisphaera marina]
MKSLLLTNEFPPNVYGGAGVHIEYLSRELAKLIPTEVRCFGDQDVQGENISVKGHEPKLNFPENGEAKFKGLFNTLNHCQSFAMEPSDADVVHCHTWYTHFAGLLCQKLYGSKLVVTTHSLEPLRPWKSEQLGRGYDVSSWVEKTAIESADLVIAVSKDTKDDVMKHFNVDEEKVQIIYNGIDTEEYSKTLDPDLMRSYGIDPDRPIVLFVGRITRQKGIIHLVNSIPKIDPSAQIVLAAGAPDTPEIEQEMKEAVDRVSENREGVIWISEMLDKKSIIKLYSHADIFCCPSIYEPFGIINLEAMSCETAVVASAVGGIKEVVVHHETGFLVPVHQLDEAPYEPVNPQNFSDDLAEEVNRLIADPDLRERMAQAGRQRAVDEFSWTSIAEKTVEAYKALL